MNQLIILVGATAFYTLFGILISRASGKMDANLIAGISNAIGAVIPLAIYAVMKAMGKVEVIGFKAEGLFYTVASGIAVAIFAILLARAFEGGGVAYVMPTIYGGTIVLASLIGWLLFKESLSPQQWAGLALIVAGIATVVASKVSA